VASKRLTWLASVADEIKFARLGVGEEHLKHAFAQAKEFVNECEAHRRATVKGRHDVFSPWYLLLLLLLPAIGWRLWSSSRTFSVPFSSTHFAIGSAGPGVSG